MCFNYIYYLTGGVKLKFLILTVTAGHGHNQTAKSVSDYIKSQGHTSLILDTLEYINPVLKESFNRGYLLSTSISPKTYGKFYRMAETKEKNDSRFTPQRITTTILSKKIINFVKEYNPDAIICTHVTAAQLVSDIKDDGLSIPTYGIITDYTIHPFWDETSIDYYIIPNELLLYQAIKKGLPKEKLLPIGIPINMKFASKVDKKIARNAVGIDDKPTVLLMSGSMGYGNIFKILQDICEVDIDFQVVVICGNNKNIKKKIDKYNYKKKVYNLGFTDQVDTYMDASDIIVTKPGGLTVSEVLAKEIPMIVINPIPGQEERNREFLLNAGVALSYSKTTKVDELIYQLFTNESRIESIKTMMRSIKKPYAAKNFIDFIIESKNNG